MAFLCNDTEVEIPSDLCGIGLNEKAKITISCTQ